jgi:D-xylose transport system permease protein
MTVPPSLGIHDPEKLEIANSSLKAKLRDLVGADDATRVNVIPVLSGLALIWGVFYVLNDRFLSAANLTNLVLQVVAIATLAIGVVLVLLIGEVDLSIGSVSGLTAAAMAILNVQHGVPAGLAIALALVFGAAIGVLQGLIIAGLGVPSFVVTLGGLIGWQGLQLALLGNTGSLNIGDPLITNLTSVFVPSWIGWIGAVLVIPSMTVLTWRRRSTRIKLELGVVPVWIDAIRLIVLTLVVAATILVFGGNLGIPLSAVILLGLLVIMDFVCRRTLFGRRVYAIGGDTEAAIRVGIKVNQVKVIVFSLATIFAAMGGIMSASRVMSVSQSSGTGEVLLNAIAAAVIGGTSLYGGRGSIWSALLGALVIGSISNGMDLLGLESPIKLMITGVVLVSAVTFDSVMRRRKAR